MVAALDISFVVIGTQAILKIKVLSLTSTTIIGQGPQSDLGFIWNIKAISHCTPVLLFLSGKVLQCAWPSNFIKVTKVVSSSNPIYTHNLDTIYNSNPSVNQSINLATHNPIRKSDRRANLMSAVVKMSRQDGVLPKNPNSPANLSRVELSSFHL